MTLTRLSSNDVLEFETTYYTDWKCSVCHVWKPRTTPARVVVRTRGETVQCREHPVKRGVLDEFDCTCHCHELGTCTRCGDSSGERW